MKNFIVISAPSGTGKSTLCRKLQERIPDLDFSISCTTRPKRSNETDGHDYYFISRDVFEEKLADGAFAEYEEVHGNFYYGTLKETLENSRRENIKVLLEVDVKGAMSIKSLYPEETVTIFISPPSEDHLRKRLEKRGTDSAERIEKRLERIREEYPYRERFDHQVVNDNLDKAVEDLIEIISNKKEGVSHGS